MTEDRAKEIAELEVRRYFDHFLKETMPKIIEFHDRDPKAHGSASRKINRLLAGIGAILALGGAVAAVVGFIASLKAILR